MAARDAQIGGIGLGGILVIVGIILMFVWSFWIGLIIALVGLIAFGGFVKGKWYGPDPPEGRRRLRSFAACADGS